MACDRTPARGWMGVAPLDKGLSRSDWGLRWEGPSGPHRSVSEVPVREPRQRRCRRSEAEPHAPPGLSPQVTGGGQAGFPEEQVTGGGQAGFPEEIPLTSV